ncbi:hypothetical protein IID20_00150, partial [Patescibacteria group bacterium]|nr:hypothetical protein [Patescibacteria group bacterium]
PNFRTAAQTAGVRDQEKKQNQTSTPTRPPDKKLAKAIARIRGEGVKMKKEKRDEGEKLDFKDQLAKIKQEMEK